jgi:hypothetical protein
VKYQVEGYDEVTEPYTPGLLGDSPDMQASARRKPEKRCAHRADGAPRSARWRFRRSETMCEVFTFGPDLGRRGLAGVLTTG